MRCYSIKIAARAAKKEVTMKKICLLLIAGLVLMFAGCKEPDGALDSSKGRLQITVSDDNAVARNTLYPNETFVKYELYFDSPTASYSPITLTNGSKTILIDDIPNGTWEITAIGYVLINSVEYPAAIGSRTATVSGGSFANVNITIYASNENDGADGFLSYNISYPSDVNFDSARILFYPYNTSQNDATPIYLNDPHNNYFHSATLSVAPGFYYFIVQLYNYTSHGIYEVAARPRMVHIYSNMETTANILFDNSDFSDLMVVPISKNGNEYLTGHISLTPYLNGERIIGDAVYSISYTLKSNVELDWLGMQFSDIFEYHNHLSNQQTHGLPVPANTPESKKLYLYTHVSALNNQHFANRLELVARSEINEEALIIIENFELEFVGYNTPTAPIMVFQGFNPEYNHWTYRFEPDWLFEGHAPQQGEGYIINYTFKSNYDIYKLAMHVVDRRPEVNWWDSLSTWQLFEAYKTKDIEHTGSVIVNINKSAAENTPLAHMLTFYIEGMEANRPILYFTNFEIIKIDPVESLENWIVSDRDFEIVNPGINTIAELLPFFEGKTDVMHIKTRSGHHLDPVIEHDLSEYEGKEITISMSMNAWLNKESRIAWQFNSRDLGWPVVCGGPLENGSNDLTSILAANQWHHLTGSLTVRIPTISGNSWSGDLLYLSGTQLADAQVYFADATLTITEVDPNNSAFINFAGFGKEAVTVTQSRQSVSLGETINFNVQGNWSSFTWLLNGNLIPGNTSTLSYSVPATAYSLLNKRNNITVVVTNSQGVPFSREAFFMVAE